MNTEKLKKLFETSKDKYGDARKMGITYQSLLNIISGKSSPTAKTLENIARFYSVPVGYFFDEAEADWQALKDKEIEQLRTKVEVYENALRILGQKIK